MTEATDLPGLLSDLGIRLKRQKPGAGTEDMVARAKAAGVTVMRA